MSEHRKITQRIAHLLKDNLSKIAYHEAGHWVMAKMFGLKTTPRLKQQKVYDNLNFFGGAVTFERRDFSYLVRRPDLGYGATMVVLAGPIAEAIYAKEPPEYGEEYEHPTDGTIFLRLTDKKLRKKRKLQAWNMVKFAWPEIRKKAKQLIAKHKGELS